jgi:hypothetical protein
MTFSRGSMQNQSGGKRKKKKNNVKPNGITVHTSFREKEKV